MSMFLVIQIILEGGTKVGSVTFFPLTMTIVTQKLPISTAYCGKIIKIPAEIVASVNFFFYAL